MRHKEKAQKPSPEQPAQKSGSNVEEEQLEKEISPTRLLGPPELSWSHAKWLALADQALLD